MSHSKIRCIMSKCLVSNLRFAKALRCFSELSFTKGITLSFVLNFDSNSNRTFMMHNLCFKDRVIV